MGEQCRQYVSRKVTAKIPTPEGPNEDSKLDLQLPAGATLSSSDLINLYFEFHKGKALNDFLLKNKDKIGTFDIINFINFGIWKRVIKRLHEYPVNLKKKEHNFFKTKMSMSYSLEGLNTPVEMDKKNRKMNDLINGEHCLDELCVELEISKPDIEIYFQKTDIHIMYK